MAVYTLFSQGTASNTGAADQDTSLGMQFTLSQPALLTGIWIYSPPGASVLPVACCIYQMTGAGTGTQVSGTVNLSPSWSGAAGSGWVKCAYGGTVVLAASTVYKVTVHQGSGVTVMYGFTHDYWDTGTGSGGLTSGIITAPNNGGGDGGQDTFTSSGSLAYPASSFQATNYWVDVEVTNTGQNVIGVAAQVTVQGGTGTPSASSSFTGTAAQVTVAGGTGSVQASALFPADSDFIPGMARPGWATPGDATTGTPASVTGVAAQVTVQGGIGAAVGGITVVGVAALVTVAGGTGTPASGANAAGVAALVTVAGGTGTPASAAAVTGTAALVTVQGGAGTPAGVANVTGVAALVTVQGGIGVPLAGITVAGVAALVTVQGGIGVAMGTGTPVNVTGVAALVTVAGGTGTASGAGVVLFTYGIPCFQWATGTPYLS